ncbi:MAG TPA: LppX_LprAFG lipoprotein, partial [Acidimicrobiales bacterium]|nr:LppX_LprAFG lipoprotein [Acidimicrobiales bacterium]
MRRLVAILPFILLSFLIASCSDDSSGGGVRAEDALARTKAAKTAEYVLKVTVTAVDKQTSTTAATQNVVVLSVEGEWDMPRNLVRSTVKYTTAEAEDSADYRVLGEVVYVQGFGAEDRKWKKYDGHDGGVGSDTLGVLRPDPAIEILAGLTGKAKKVGNQRIGGTQTTHFQAKADLKRAIAKAEADARDALQSRLDNTEDGQADIDLWLDSDGRIRRLVTLTKAKG